jgi:hypothetical protein
MPPENTHPVREVRAPWYTHLPGWGAGETTGVGPGLQGPDYSHPRPAQPGEAPQLLPAFPGDDTTEADQNRALIRHGHQPPGATRLPPYVERHQQIVFHAGGVALADLGRPDQGYRWLLRHIAVFSATQIDDPTATGFYAHFYVGTPPLPGTVPVTSDWVWDLLSVAATDFTRSEKFTDSSLQVLGQQHLYVYLTHGTDGYSYIAKAHMEQISDTGTRLVTAV